MRADTKHTDTDGRHMKHKLLKDEDGVSASRLLMSLQQFVARGRRLYTRERERERERKRERERITEARCLGALLQVKSAALLFCFISTAQK